MTKTSFKTQWRCDYCRNVTDDTVDHDLEKQHKHKHWCGDCHEKSTFYYTQIPSIQTIWRCPNCDFESLENVETTDPDQTKKHLCRKCHKTTRHTWTHCGPMVMVIL